MARTAGRVERVTTRIRSHTSSEVAVAATVQVAAQIAHHIHGVEAGEPASERRPRHRGGLGGAPETRQHQRGVLARTDHEGAQRGLQRLGAAARHELQQMAPGGPGAAAQPRRDVPAGGVGVHHDRGPWPLRGDRQTAGGDPGRALGAEQTDQHDPHPPLPTSTSSVLSLPAAAATSSTAVSGTIRSTVRRPAASGSPMANTVARSPVDPVCDGLRGRRLDDLHDVPREQAADR